MPDISSENRALFNLGFRPFFLGAAAYSIIVVLLWMAIYVFQAPFPFDGITAYQWHAHEMIYGYTLAVIAGFLLTAVKNWTGVQTVRGGPLAVLFGIWLLARLCFSVAWFNAAAFVDMLFTVLLFYFIASPVVRTRNWRQMVILSKLLFLVLSNLAFYLGYAGKLSDGVHWGIYGGLYLVISLMLTVGARVIPFFIERGVGYPVKLSSPRWIMISGLAVFLVFFVSEVFLRNSMLTGISALVLFVIYAFRLIGWYTRGIWKKPLLWSLYTAMIFIDLAFLLFAISAFSDLSKYLAIHTLAYGGIGLMTAGMICRVTLGHTGRDIHEVGKVVKFIFLALIIGTVFRVVMPMAVPDMYTLWILISQVLWIISFMLIMMQYGPMLMTPRVDGQPG